MSVTLRPYQQEAVAFLVERQRALLALPPGAGKTAIVAKALNFYDGPRPYLIVTPAGPVLHHWMAETARWAGLSTYNGSGGAKHRVHMRHDVAAGEGHGMAINYEAFRTDIDELLGVEWSAVVFDESHRLKNRQSQTFKAAAKLAKRVDRLYLVTGTPVLNRATELWASLHLMEPGKYKSFWRWAEYHFQINYPRYRRRVVREVGDLHPGHVPLLRAEIGDRMFYRPLADILPELPPVIETFHEVYLTAEERRAYETMETNFWMEVGEEVIQAPNAIARQTRLRQLASDWSCWGEGPGTKAKAAAGLVEALDGEQCIVFCAFRASAIATQKLIGPSARAYHGGLSMEERSQLVEAFKAGELRTLVATIATLGEGVDGLQVARNAIFIDRDWTPARNDQAIGRLRRQGQRNAVNVMHVVAEDTIDDTVASALRAKRDVVSAVIEGRIVEAGI